MGSKKLGEWCVWFNDEEGYLTTIIVEATCVEQARQKAEKEWGKKFEFLRANRVGE